MREDNGDNVAGACEHSRRIISQLCSGCSTVTEYIIMYNQPFYEKAQQLQAAYFLK
jgi:hypothetical protein